MSAISQCNGMNRNHLALFYAVAEAGSVTRAAERLHVSQPAVSKQILELEDVSLLRNWMSLSGLVVVIGSLFSFFLLFVLDAVAHFSNPYLGILTYIIAPGFLISGLLLTV